LICSLKKTKPTTGSPGFAQIGLARYKHNARRRPLPAILVLAIGAHKALEIGTLEDTAESGSPVGWRQEGD